MKTIKGDDIIEKIKDFQVKGCESWVDLVKYIMLQLKGKRLFVEAELEEKIEELKKQVDRQEISAWFPLFLKEEFLKE